MALNAKTREIVGKKVKQLRAEGLVPASVYGPAREPKSIAINPKEFRTTFEEVGYSKLFGLKIDEEKAVKVLVKEVQVDPVRDNILHISLYEVDMKKPITADVPIRVTEITEALKNSPGLLMVPVDSLPVHCLPADLPEEIMVDISELKDIGDSITVDSITLPEGVTFDYEVNPETTLAYVAAPQKSLEEEAEAEADAEADRAELEAEEGEEGEAGEAAAETGAEGEAKAEKPEATE